MVETPQPPEEQSFNEELVRRSHGDPQLFDLLLEEANWSRAIEQEHGIHNLSPERRQQFFDLQGRQLTRIRELREQGIIGPEED